MPPSTTTPSFITYHWIKRPINVETRRRILRYRLSLNAMYIGIIYLNIISVRVWVCTCYHIKSILIIIINIIIILLLCYVSQCVCYTIKYFSFWYLSLDKSFINIFFLQLVSGAYCFIDVFSERPFPESTCLITTIYIYIPIVVLVDVSV
jgi:hypothetical protein